MVSFPEIMKYFLLLSRCAKCSKHLVLHNLIAPKLRSEPSYCTSFYLFFCFSPRSKYTSQSFVLRLSSILSPQSEKIGRPVVYYLLLNLLEQFDDCQAFARSFDSSSLYVCDNRLTSLVDGLA
jgi:hypothetical protein